MTHLYYCPSCGLEHRIEERLMFTVSAIACECSYLIDFNKTEPTHSIGEEEKRTQPFLTAADIVMLREMKIGIGIKLEAS